MGFLRVHAGDVGKRRTPFGVCLEEIEPWNAFRVPTVIGLYVVVALV
jgi:hypothetical protein